MLFHPRNADLRWVYIARSVWGTVEQSCKEETRLIIVRARWWMSLHGQFRREQLPAFAFSAEAVEYNYWSVSHSKDGGQSNFKRSLGFTFSPLAEAKFRHKNSAHFPLTWPHICLALFNVHCLAQHDVGWVYRALVHLILPKLTIVCSQSISHTLWCILIIDMCMYDVSCIRSGWVQFMTLLVPLNLNSRLCHCSTHWVLAGLDCTQHFVSKSCT